jgi:hypothetical protein
MYTYFRSDGNSYKVEIEITDLDFGFYLKVKNNFLHTNAYSSSGFAQSLCFDSDQCDSGFILPYTFIL